MIEMAFRAYDPCYGCATHSLPGRDAASGADPRRGRHACLAEVQQS